MMKINRILILFLTVFMLCGCDNYKELDVKSYTLEQIANFSFEKGAVSSKMRLDVAIDNPTSSKYLIKQVNAIVYTGNHKKFAEITSIKPATVFPKSDQIVPVMINVVLFNPLSALSSGLFSSDSIDREDMTVDLDMIIKSGLFSKRIREEGLSVEQLMQQLSGSDTKEEIK